MPTDFLFKALLRGKDHKWNFKIIWGIKSPPMAERLKLNEMVAWLKLNEMLAGFSMSVKHHIHLIILYNKVGLLVWSTLII